MTITFETDAGKIEGWMKASWPGHGPTGITVFNFRPDSARHVTIESSTPKSPTDASDLVIPLVDERGCYLMEAERGCGHVYYWADEIIDRGDAFSSAEAAMAADRVRLATHRLRALAAAMNPNGWEPDGSPRFLLITEDGGWKVAVWNAYRFIHEIPFASRESAERALAIMQAEGLMDFLRPR